MQLNENINMKEIIIFLFVLLIAIAFGTFTLESSSVDNNTVPGCELSNFQATDAPFKCEVASETQIKKLKNELHMDQALVKFIVQSHQKKNFTLYAKWDVCWKCPCINLTELPVHKIGTKGENVSCVLDTRFPILMKVVDQDNKDRIISGLHKKLAEYGFYYWWIDDLIPGNSSSNFYAESPNDSNIPIYVAIGVIAGLCLLTLVIKVIYRKGYLNKVAVCIKPHERLINTDLGTPEDHVDGIVNNSGEEKSVPPPAKQRLKSLDTFRGLSLVIMIFVNYSGGGYWFFHHSAWNGLTVADLVFPWFTFIMGTSIALAFRKMVARGTSKVQLITKVTKRTAILFVLGLMISNDGSKGFVEVSKLRIPGVLQRLAVTYFVVATTEVFFAGRSLPTEPDQVRWWPFRDIIPFWPEWVVSLGILTLQLSLTFLLKVPGCPTGYLGPGGLHENFKHENCTGGAAGYIDRVVFGEQHIYGHPTCKIPYQTTVPYDPEGIMGTLTSIFMCFLGLQAGKILVIYPHHVQRIKRWAIWGVVCGLIAGSLCKFSQNDGWIPVNKNFWSVSFVLGLSSMSFFLLIFCYVTIDIWGIWTGAPFLYPGMNSIVVYMCHEVFHKFFPIQFAVANTHTARLALHLYGTAIWTIMAGVMYYKKIFIAI